MQICANTFHGLSRSFAMMILMDALFQMCLECQYEAKNYTFKEAKVLNWWSITIKLALEETVRMGKNSKKRLWSWKAPWLWNNICLGMLILRPYLF
jgi:hypothetical protein